MIATSSNSKKCKNRLTAWKPAKEQVEFALKPFVLDINRTAVIKQNGRGDFAVFSDGLFIKEWDDYDEDDK